MGLYKIIRDFRGKYSPDDVVSGEYLAERVIAHVMRFNPDDGAVLTVGIRVIYGPNGELIAEGDPEFSLDEWHVRGTFPSPS
jgi:hypothetical protein